MDKFLCKGMKTSNIEKFQSQGWRGTGISILVLDTGYSEHEYIKKNIVECKNFTNEIDYKDNNGHGTFVIGEILQVAPNSKIYVGKVLDDKGNGSYDSIINGLKWGIELGVDIINMSLGATKDTNELYITVKEAINKGISIVCSAGNNGDGNPNTDELEYPACYEEVINVGAIDINKKIAPYSNSNTYVDLCAVGTDITSTYKEGNKWCRCSGTSMSTPIVSGFLALLKEKFIYQWDRNPSEKELYARLIKNTVEIKGLKPHELGNGFLYYTDTDDDL